MTLNETLSIPNALKRERPEDYHKNTATIEWPDGADGQPLAIRTTFHGGRGLQGGRARPLAKEFVRFLVGEGWLMHYLNFSGERMLPAMPKLLEQPFWLDPSDRASHDLGDPVPDPPARLQLWVASGDPRHMLVKRERVWAKAVHRVAAEGVSPEQAVDEAIARIKQILAE